MCYVSWYKVGLREGAFVYQYKKPYCRAARAGGTAPTRWGFEFDPSTFALSLTTLTRHAPGSATRGVTLRTRGSQLTSSTVESTARSTGPVPPSICSSYGPRRTRSRYTGSRRLTLNHNHIKYVRSPSLLARVAHTPKQRGAHLTKARITRHNTTHLKSPISCRHVIDATSLILPKARLVR